MGTLVWSEAGWASAASTLDGTLPIPDHLLAMNVSFSPALILDRLVTVLFLDSKFSTTQSVTTYSIPETWVSSGLFETIFHKLNPLA